MFDAICPGIINELYLSGIAQLLQNPAKRLGRSATVGANVGNDLLKLRLDQCLPIKIVGLELDTQALDCGTSGIDPR